jgi:hypothetical protein
MKGSYNSMDEIWLIAILILLLSRWNNWIKRAQVIQKIFPIVKAALVRDTKSIDLILRAKF